MPRMAEHPDTADDLHQQLAAVREERLVRLDAGILDPPAARAPPPTGHDSAMF